MTLFWLKFYTDFTYKPCYSQVCRWANEVLCVLGQKAFPAPWVSSIDFPLVHWANPSFAPLMIRLSFRLLFWKSLLEQPVPPLPEQLILLLAYFTQVNGWKPLRDISHDHSCLPFFFAALGNQTTLLLNTYLDQPLIFTVLKLHAPTVGKVTEKAFIWKNFLEPVLSLRHSHLSGCRSQLWHFFQKLVWQNVTLKMLIAKTQIMGVGGGVNHYG